MEQNENSSEMISHEFSTSQVNIDAGDSENKERDNSLILFSQDQKASESMSLSKMKENEDDIEKLAAQTPSESKVGKILSESTQKAVITLVLSMLLSSAVLDPTLYIVEETPYLLGLKILTYSQTDGFHEAINSYLDSFKDDNAPLLQVVVGDFEWTDGTDLAALRAAEKQVTFYLRPETDEFSVAVNDLRQFTKTGAILGMVTTLVICVVLAMGSLLLSKVTQDLVLTPIEDMITRVKEITKNPIQAAQQAEEDAVK